MQINPALTGVRGILALLIFFFHWLFAVPEQWPQPLHALFDTGYTRVGAMFALSAFLITQRNGPRIVDGTFRAGPFLWRRVLRLYPLYLLVLVLFVFVPGRPVGQADTTMKVVANLLLVQWAVPGIVLSGIGTGWTLGLDMLFAMVAPALLPLWVRQPSVRRTLALGAVATTALLGVALLLSSAIKRLHLMEPGSEAIHYVLTYTAASRMPDYLAGLTMAAVLFRMSAQMRARLVRALPLLVALTLGAFWFADAVDTWGRQLIDRLGGLLFTWAFSMLLAALAADDQARHAWSAALANPLLVMLGRVSFPLYLIQLTEPSQWLYWIALRPLEGTPVLHALALLMALLPLCALLLWVQQRWQPARA